MDLLQKIAECTAFISEKTSVKPQVGIILGTGLGGLVNHIEIETTIDYSDIPHFVAPTVMEHEGKLIFGTIEGKAVMVMQGRFHFYEGYSLEEITFPVRVMKAIGCEYMFVSNACGGINPKFKAGDVMLIEDHINLLGTSPLVGKNHTELGDRFPDMIEPYNNELRALAKRACLEDKIPVQEGVYAVMSGPNLETRAEYRMLGIIGADVIGMSTVPEATVAVHAGLKTLGISVITDECLPDALKPVNLDKIIATAMGAEPKLVGIIKGVLSRL
ncbi:MAG: purine-nucleoside phosphorylase [Fibrobacterales bacterium]